MFALPLDIAYNATREVLPVSTVAFEKPPLLIVKLEVIRTLDSAWL